MKSNSCYVDFYGTWTVGSTDESTKVAGGYRYRKAENQVQESPATRCFYAILPEFTKTS